MVARASADLVMVVHFAVLVFLVVGGFLAWRWPKVLYFHLAMATWGLLIILFPLACPLTWLENELRTAAGQPQLVSGFIDTYIDGVLYPDSAARLVQVLVALVVLVSWFGYYLKRRVDQTTPTPTEACR
ncbi:hypothetical protein ADK67_00795 [Saccharothrix sp. NRRL B-16348]|uniref:DUF2784 domain-containing protein n=1 Tax=Saccharothrix sp. NRRL B-16348 TaxID=1415542 RepID=UPI0006AF3B39|nr:DUF2784 domain-containing protein [Saccharothrix sp. NRRL B-16348]KOX35083.1 hypothetical protein ADK67_00795 [Saccharothrix sp. NRRL B-16348]